MTSARVILWGTRIGAVTWENSRGLGIFQFEPDFIDTGIEVAPLRMPARSTPYEFPALPRESFKGLPGMLADSLPDKFGNRLIDAWLAETGRSPDEFNPVKRLCYIGRRGIGALEFEPMLARPKKTNKLQISRLVELTNRVIKERASLSGRLTGEDDASELEDILSVGTSAGGARAKAVLAWNPKTCELRSGQLDADEGFEHWLLKFDGVSNNSDKELADAKGYGKIEFAYYNMAHAAGITMSDCRLHHEGGRSHFMTKRFDRDVAGNKIHMQSLAAMQHFDFHDPSAYSYEQAILTIRKLGLGTMAVEEQFRRALFNVIARNQDDHVKNIGFLMQRSGQWELSPAFDITYSYKPEGLWTRDHQMSLAGRRNNFELEDIMKFAESVGIKSHRAGGILDQLSASVRDWPLHAEAAGVAEDYMVIIQNSFRSNLILPTKR